MKLFWQPAIGAALAAVMFVPSARADEANAPKADADQSGATILNPSEAVPSQDYPPSSYRSGEEGTVGFKLWADSSGKLLDCKVTKSSGFVALDERVCTSIRARGKFVISGKPNEPDGRYSLTDSVHWVLPPGPSRALFLGVTLASSKPASDNRTRCVFSDGLVLFVPKAAPCVLDTPRQTITEGSESRSVNIVDQYLDLYAKDHKPEEAFDAAVILAANQYSQAIDYLVKASDDGLGLASFAVCGLETMPRNTLRNVYDPKEAVHRCLMAHDQGFDLGIVLIRQFLAKHPDAATDEQKQFLSTYQPHLPIATTDAVLTVPESSLIRSKDCPKDALKHHVQGRTVAMFKINEQGRVQNCLIIKSSLSFALDRTVCSRLEEAAIYTPATLLGQPTAIWKSQAVAWRAGHKGDRAAGTLFGALLGAIVGHAM